MDDSSSRSDASEYGVRILLEERQLLTSALGARAYDPILYLQRAVVHTNMGYPDLAAGDAYRALLLTDEARDESFEYHHQARRALEKYSPNTLPQVLKYGTLVDGISNMPYGSEPYQQLAAVATLRCLQILSLSLLLCGCLKSARTFCERGLAIVPKNQDLLETRDYIEQVARRRLRRDVDSDGPERININDLPDRGVVRREIYPWNSHEPDRFAAKSLSSLNNQLADIAPKCEVRVTELPALLEAESETDGYDIIPTMRQLGLFAVEDIAPGELVLQEYSLLTANNRHKESTCDACGSELPPLAAGSPAAVSCPDCHDSVFCNDFCFEQAVAQYHPAVCDKDVDSIAKDPDAREADDSLYLLLLARLLAIAAHKDVHPLDVAQIKYIWGDFVSSQSNDIDLSADAQGPPPEWTLPFSFRYNIELPLHMLEKMDVDIYATLDRYDLWVFNTAYGKFRGTASARKSHRDGRPDVAAVHPFWCLANHDCDPNVTWEWGGRMQLWARPTRVLDGRPGGIAAGEEVLSHYCDVNLPVQQRREWARGSLGGWCMCQRCRNEAVAQPNGS